MKHPQGGNYFSQIHDCLAYISINMMWTSGTEESLGFRRTGWTRRPWATTSLARLTSTRPRWDKYKYKLQIHTNTQFVLPHRWDKYKNKFQVHTNTQTAKVDAAKGFGGKFGVAEQKDKSALGWDHLEKVEKHTSSKGNFLFVPTLCPL